VAEAILHCAETGQPEITVGGGGKMISAMNHYAPRLTDKFMEKVFAKQEQSKRPPRRPRAQNGLDQPMGTLEERGNYPGHTRETSLYTAATMHPLVTTAAVLAGAGVGLAAWLSRPTSEKANNGQKNKVSGR
jgi:hypothetical protein